MQRLNIKDLLLLVDKLIKYIPDARNAKEHQQSFITKKNRTSVKQSAIITYQPKSFGIADIKSVITEHPKTSQKLSKTIRQGDKVGSNSSLFKGTKKNENFLNEKTIKITKREHAFKGYASIYNIEILFFLTLN